MKRVVLGAVLLASTAAFAEETQRYIVSTRGPARMATSMLARGENVRAMRHVDVAVMDLTATEAAELRKSAHVRFIEPDSDIRALGDTRAFGTLPIASHRNRSAQSTPYGIDMVRAADVWKYATAEIRVGVVDSGIDHQHPDLKDNYAGGYDFYNKDADPMDDNGHGTHVAGTIAAADNALGVIGVAPNVRLYGLKVLDGEGNGKTSLLIEAIDWAITNKLKVLNFSLGSDTGSFGLQQAFQKAADHNILTIAASGNSFDDNGGIDGLAYPAAYPTVLSVGAVNYKKQIGAFSQRGVELDVVAPGLAVLSTYPVGKAEISLLTAGENQYEARPIAGTPATAFSGEFVFAGLGGTKDFPSSVRGKIALIERGTYQFWEKIQNAKNAGATGVIIYNRDGADEPEYSPFNGTVVPSGGTPSPTNAGDPTYPTGTYEWLPAVGMSRLDGLALRQFAGSVNMGAAVPDDYTELQGTSMASPHVAGIAALIWSIAPESLAEQVRQAIQLTAADLGLSGRDNTFGYGLVDALAAAKHLAPHKFMSIPPSSRSRRVGRGN